MESLRWKRFSRFLDSQKPVLKHKYGKHMNFECHICQVTAGDMSNSFVCTIKLSFVIHALHTMPYEELHWKYQGLHLKFKDLST